MDSVKNLPGTALWVIALSRDAIEAARNAKSLEDAQVAINKIDEFLVRLHQLADAARIELEDADNANRT